MDILEGVLDEFKKLAAIPRANGHEQAVSDFLKKYLTDAGFSVVQDAKNNIIADKPATKGYENAPRTILQGHMDMVAVGEEGYDYDPLKDPIKLVRTDKYLEAEGTSLGAVPISGEGKDGLYANGYDVQIAQYVANKLGMKLEIYAIEWDSLLPALESGTIDAIVAGMSPTAERAQQIDFTNTYYESNLVVIIRK